MPWRSTCRWWAWCKKHLWWRCSWDSLQSLPFEKPPQRSSSLSAVRWTPCHRSVSQACRMPVRKSVCSSHYCYCLACCLCPRTWRPVLAAALPRNRLRCVGYWSSKSWVSVVGRCSFLSLSSLRSRSTALNSRAQGSGFWTLPLIQSVGSMPDMSSMQPSRCCLARCSGGWWFGSSCVVDRLPPCRFRGYDCSTGTMTPSTPATHTRCRPCQWHIA